MISEKNFKHQHTDFLTTSGIFTNKNCWWIIEDQIQIRDKYENENRLAIRAC